LPAAQQEWLTANMPGWLPNKTVNLGLDLRGGSHLLLEADTKAVLAEHMKSMKSAALNELRKSKILYVFGSLAVKKNGSSFKLQDPAKDGEEAKRIARGLDQNAVTNISDDGTVSVTLNEKGLNDLNTQVIEQSIEIVRRRVDETGTKEPIIQRQGT